MKKLILSFLLLSLPFFVFGQSITLTPAANDSQILTGYGNGPNIVGLRAKGTPASPTAVIAGDNLFTLQGRGYNGSSFVGDVIGIVFDANQTFTSTAKGTTMQFYTTTNNTTTVLERMRINHDGNIGIGTTTPDTKLHIYNGNSGRIPYSLSSIFTENSSHNYIEIASPDASEKGLIFSNPTDGASGGIYYNAKKMSFRSGTNDTRMTINDIGNIGIGTATPNAKLDIAGDIILGKKSTISTPGTQNALNRQGASYISVTASGTVTINGIAGGVDGMIVFLYSSNSSTVVLNHINGSAAFSDQIVTNTGSAVTLSGRGGVTLLYVIDGWRVIGVAN